MLVVTAELETHACTCNNHFHQKSYLNFSVMYFYGHFDLISSCFTKRLYKNNLKNDVFNQDFFPYVTMIGVNMQYVKNIRVKFQ